MDLEIPGAYPAECPHYLTSLDDPDLPTNALGGNVAECNASLNAG